MSLLTRIGAGLQRIGNVLSVVFGITSGTAVEGHKIPGPHPIDTTGAADGHSLFYDAGTGKYLPGAPEGVDVAADYAWTGVHSWSQPIGVGVEDATSNDYSGCAIFAHSTTGTAAAGMGAMVLFAAENAAGDQEFAGACGASWASPAGGAETGRFDIFVRAGSSLTKAVRVHPSLGVSIGTTVDPGAGALGTTGAIGVGRTPAATVGVYLPNDRGVYGRNAGDTQDLRMVSVRTVDGADAVQLGDHAVGVGVYVPASGTNGFRVATNGVTLTLTTGGVLILGNPDGVTITPTINAKVRPANVAAGVLNVEGGSLELKGGLGTGSADPGAVIITGGVKGSSGTAQHVEEWLAGFMNSATASDTAMLVRVNRAGVFSLDRVKIGAVDSGGSGLRALCIAN